MELAGLGWRGTDPAAVCVTGQLIHLTGPPKNCKRSGAQIWTLASNKALKKPCKVSHPRSQKVHTLLTCCVGHFKVFNVRASF